MALDANTYGTVAGVERMIGDIVNSRTFAADTVPTLAECETALDAIASVLNARLDVMGYTMPVDSDDYPAAYGLLAEANNNGAAARLLATIPPQAFDPDEQMEELGTTRSQMYERYLNQVLKQIDERKVRAGMRKGRFFDLRTGARDSDGNVKDPLFRRRMDEYPGARSLPREE
jgi:hypothetical protein